MICRPTQRRRMVTELRATPIAGVWELQGQAVSDQRERSSMVFVLRSQPLLRPGEGVPLPQVNLSRTDAVGSVRGLHLQASPHSEAKLVRCLRGRVWDVAVDLRAGSATRGQWHGLELRPEGPMPC